MQRTNFWEIKIKRGLCWRFALLVVLIFIGCYLRYETNHFRIEKEIVQRELDMEAQRFPKSESLLVELREEKAKLPWLEMTEETSVQIISWEEDQHDRDTRKMIFTIQGTYPQLIELISAWESGPPWSIVRVENLAPLLGTEICEMTVIVQAQ